MTGAPWPDVQGELLSYVGLVEGPNNDNPFGVDFGYPNVSYCAQCATGVPHRHGVDWGDDAIPVAHVGYQYVPYLWSRAVREGWAEVDRTSHGAPAVAQPGDLYVWDWNFDGVGDHVETALAYDDGSDGYAHNLHGANTGNPEGVHAWFSRHRSLLQGVIHMAWAYPDGGAPQPPSPPGLVLVPQPPAAPAPGPTVNPFLPLDVDGDRGFFTHAATQWSLLDSQVADINGNQLIVDGQWGRLTASSLQRYLGVAIDGDFGHDSTVALQTHVGAWVDGDWGPDTTTRLQQALNSLSF